MCTKKWDKVVFIVFQNVSAVNIIEKQKFNLYLGCPDEIFDTYRSAPSFSQVS